MWPIALSGRLPVVGTVGRYPAVYLMGRDPIPSRQGFPGHPMRGAREYPVLASVSRGCPGGGGRLVTCYSPVRHSIPGPKPSYSFDLHVLGAPPAFILSQDQTLRGK